MYELTYNGHLAIIPLVLYILMLVRYKNIFQQTERYTNTYEWLVIYILLVLSSVFAFESHDTYHYMEGYELSKVDGGYYEDIYRYFAQITNNYFEWRFFIWGLASVFILLAAYILRLAFAYLGFVIPVFFLTQFVITRGALGFSFLMFTTICFTSYLSKGKGLKNIILLALSFVGMIYSMNLHRSIVIYLVLLPLSVLIPIKKITLKTSLILFPLFYVSAVYLLNTFSGLEVLNDRQEFIQGYAAVEEINLSLNGFIRVYIERLPWYIFGFIMIYRMSSETNRPIRVLCKYSFLLLYISAITFRQEAIGPWLSTRTIHAASFPLLFCATYYLKNYKLERWTKISIALFIVTVFLYHFLVNILNWW